MVSLNKQFINTSYLYTLNILKPVKWITEKNLKNSQLKIKE